MTKSRIIDEIPLSNKKFLVRFTPIQLYDIETMKSTEDLQEEHFKVI
jgi:hypothetical protein